MIDTLYDFRNNLNENGIFFCFNGPISQDLLVEMGDLLKQKLQLEDAGRSTVIKVFSFVIEQAQNILHHSDERIHFPGPGADKDYNVGIIAVGYEQDHYFLICGNKIEKTKVQSLRSTLSSLQKMNKEELKHYYREQRKQPSHSHHQGAGLGFIEMARKASKPIEFDFVAIDDDYSFFSLKTVI